MIRFLFWNVLVLLIIEISSADLPIIWSDEFSTSTIDTTKWSFTEGKVGNGELECYTNRSQNVFIQRGYLTIQALRESYDSCNYTSARIQTQYKFSTLFGKMEIRAKVPTGNGLLAAFLMFGDNIATDGWPACGQIDVMDFLGRTPSAVYASLHGTNINSGAQYDDSKGFSTDFHIYALDWQPNKLQWSVDGNIYKTVHPYDFKGNWQFNKQTMFLSLYLSVGGSWPGNPDSSTIFPKQFIVDYVRVYNSTCCSCTMKDEL